MFIVWCGYFKLLVAFNVCTVTFLNIKSFTNSYSRRFYWYIPGVSIKAEFIEQNRTDSAVGNSADKQRLVAVVTNVTNVRVYFSPKLSTSSIMF